MKKTRLPKGWTEADVRDVIDYYDNQTDDEAALEMEARDLGIDGAVVVVPFEPVPRVREMHAEFERKNLKAQKRNRRNRKRKRAD
jgi:hypothetical protein